MPWEVEYTDEFEGCVLYAFDPRRVAILLLGGSKVGDDRWYEEFIPKADRIYDEHLRALEGEGSSNG